MVVLAAIAAVVAILSLIAISGYILWKQRRGVR